MPRPKLFNMALPSNRDRREFDENRRMVDFQPGLPIDCFAKVKKEVVMKPAESEQIELIARMRHRDEAALEIFVRLNGPKVKHWIRSKYGSILQSVEIEEAISVTFYNAWRFSDRFDSSKGAINSWLIGIAKNAVLGILRGSKKHRSKHLEYDDSYDPAAVAQTSPIERFNEVESGKIRAAINELPKLQRKVILADLASGGFSDDARLADEFDTTKKSIQVSRSKAKKKLYRSLTELGLNPNKREFGVGYE